MLSSAIRTYFQTSGRPSGQQKKSILFWDSLEFPDQELKGGGVGMVSCLELFVFFYTFTQSMIWGGALPAQTI